LFGIFVVVAFWNFSPPLPLKKSEKSEKSEKTKEYGAFWRRDDGAKMTRTREK
jgi:hypothetical protein